MHAALSCGTLLQSVMSQQNNCLMELYTNFTKLCFSWKYFFALLLYLGMLGLRWLRMHLWLNLINRTIDIHEKKKGVKIYVQSQWRVVLLWGHRFWQSSILRGWHTKLCIISSLKCIQISSKFVLLGFVKLFSPHPNHIVVWGNFPFKVDPN